MIEEDAFFKDKPMVLESVTSLQAQRQKHF
jgi:hypothetical protein